MGSNTLVLAINTYLGTNFAYKRKLPSPRNPVSSDSEAIHVRGESDDLLKLAYAEALLSSGFAFEDTAFIIFTPCPLGTFINVSTKGTDGCQDCPPGNLHSLLSIL